MGSAGGEVGKIGHVCLAVRVGVGGGANPISVWPAF